MENEQYATEWLLVQSRNLNEKKLKTPHPYRTQWKWMHKHGSWRKWYGRFSVIISSKFPIPLTFASPSWSPVTWKCALLILSQSSCRLAVAAVLFLSSNDVCSDRLLWAQAFFLLFDTAFCRWLQSRSRLTWMRFSAQDCLSCSASTSLLSFSV